MNLRTTSLSLVGFSGAMVLVCTSVALALQLKIYHNTNNQPFIGRGRSKIIELLYLYPYYIWHLI